MKAKKSITGDAAFRELISKGYRAEYDISGSISEVGYGVSTISNFVLYDENGKDVTDEYSITLSEGKLHIYIKELYVESESITSVFNNTYIKAEKYNSTALLDGHTLMVTFGEGRRNVGQSDNKFTCTVVDMYGNDVSYMYLMSRKYGKIVVEYQELTITADSTTMTLAELKALGGEYYASEYTSEGTIPENCGVYVEVEGSISGRGRSASYINYVKITSADGEDITNNFSITYVDGVLTVTQ